MRKTIAVVICLSLVVFSAGIQPWQAVAAEVVKVKVQSGAGALPTLPAAVPGARAGALDPRTTFGLPGAFTGSLPLSPRPAVSVQAHRAPAAVFLPPAAALPSRPQVLPASVLASEPAAYLPAAAPAGSSDFARTFARLSAPSLLSGLPAQAGGESVQAVSGRDFARRIAQDAEAGAQAVAVPAAPAAVSLSGRLAPSGSSPVLPAAGRAAVSVPQTKQARSPVFPVLGALGAGLAWALTWLGAPADGMAQSVVSGMGYAALAVAAVFAVEAVSDLAAYTYGVWRGRHVTDADFWDFVRAEVSDGRIDAGVAEMLRAHRPGKGDWSLDFGFTAGREIYIRPELSATPWLFRRVLSHELGHLRDNAQRGPPAGRLRAFWRYMRSEVRARASEFKSAKVIRNTRIPLLERALKSAQLSLALPGPYDVLVMNAASPELKDPAVYSFLSQGKANIEVADGSVPQEVLGQPRNLGRFKAIVLDQAFTMLPADQSLDAKRLDQALEQLDSIFVMATRLTPQPEAFAGDAGLSRRYMQLAGLAGSAAAQNDRKGKERFEKLVREFWRDVSASKLQGMQVTEIINSLYRAMPDKGLAFLPFGPADPGLPVWEKLLRFWEAADGGQFRLTRVDLENGGHILILRKMESRVGLWLRPSKGFLALSVPDVGSAADSRETARTALAASGFSAQLDKFDELEVEIRHVFGADVGRQEIYVTVPRRNAGAMRRYVSGTAMEMENARNDFEPHLMESAGLVKVKPIWQVGVTGTDGTIMWIDTGADNAHEDFGGRLDVVDMVHEGGEDWAGHGTHVAGISISGDGVFTGMAKTARGIMAKVFSRESPGASDGDIMASAALAIQKGVDVINVSLGSRGSSSDNLAAFFSQLTHQKNSNGEYPFVAASAGNAGPFDRTLSQPAAGVDVFATGAANLGEDDKVVEISFFSSVGPDLDKRYAVKRARLKPDAATKGGNVTTEAGSNNVYRLGVYSTKSKNMAKSPADTPDGRHTGMSGTSMASPMLAGIAMLLKLAMRLCGAEDEFAKENMPLVLKALILRTADDMQIPVWFQGAGLVNAWAAVKLTADTVGYVFRNSAARLLSRARSAGAAAPGGPWDWVRRYKNVMDIEDEVYSAAEVVKSEARAKFDDGSGDDGETAVDERRAMGDIIQSEVMEAFQKKRAEVLPRILDALKDPVWLVRRQAAMVLFNLQAPESAMLLAEAALHDADSRVRQMAMLALAELPEHSTDILLQKASADPHWDTAIYAAYALARHGDRAGVARIMAELSHQDKWVRFSAAWLLGQLGSRAAAAEAEALAYLVKNAAERGNIRHLAAAALSNLAAEQPAAISDLVVKDLLASAGPHNLALTRTAGKVFPIALRSKELVARMRAEPLRSVVVDFVQKNKSAVSRPGALGELVSLLARVINLPLEMPTPVPDPNGAGVSGVDQTAGPLDVIIELPSDRKLSSYREAGDAAAALAEAGLGADILDRFGAGFRAALPLSRSLWLSVPAHKLFALGLELRNRGYSLRVSQPEYSLTRRIGDASWRGLTLDLSGEYAGVPAGADLSLVRIIADKATSEAKVMAALEALRARIGDPLRRPAVIAVSLGNQSAPRSPLSRLINAMLLEDFGVVLPAGNEGPADNSVSGLVKGSLAVVVAAAGRTAGLESYSARGSAESPVISWADQVEDLEAAIPVLADAAAAAARAVLGPEASEPIAVGTGAAAERTADKLAMLARNMRETLSEHGAVLPQGYFFYLAEIVKRTLSQAPEDRPQGSGAGIFKAADQALELLQTRLLDPAPVFQEAARQADAARRRQQDWLPPTSTFKAAEKAIFAAAHAVGNQTVAQPRIVAAAAELARGLDAAYGRRAGDAPSPADGVEQVKQLRAVLGAGTNTPGGKVEPFVFRRVSGATLRARAAGLEGFLYGKLQAQRSGNDPLDPAQIDDYFQYLDDLLAACSWTTGLRRELAKLRRGAASPEERDSKLDAMLTAAVKEYQTELRAADASNWSRGAGIYMILARAYNRLKPGKNFFESLDDNELMRIKSETRADSVWLLDIFEIGEYERWGSAGGSPYAIRGYRIKPELGGDDAFKRFVRRAHALGLKVGVDEMPNHVALDSDLSRQYPEMLMHIVPPQDLSRSEIEAQAPPFFYYMETDSYPEGGRRVHKKLLVQHPRGDSGEGVWLDMAQRDYSRRSTRAWEVAEARRMIEDWGVDVLHRNMAGSVTNERYYAKWVALLSQERDNSQGWARAEMDRFIAEFKQRWSEVKDQDAVEEATYAPKASRPSAAMLDEAYGYSSELSRTGSNGVYNKDDHDLSLGQVGLYDALASRNAARIRAALENVAFRAWQRGGAGLVNFLGTHSSDTGNPVDRFGRLFKASALITLLLRPILVYNGQEQGVGQEQNIKAEWERSSDKGKAIPFDVPAVIDWSKKDTGNQEFLRFMFAKSAEYRDLFEHGAMDVLAPSMGTPLVAYSVSAVSGKARRTILAAANFSDIKAGGWFRFRAALEQFGAFKPAADKDYILRDLADVKDGQPAVYRRSGRELAEQGLYLELSGGGVHLFEIAEAPAA